MSSAACLHANETLRSARSRSRAQRCWPRAAEATRAGSVDVGADLQGADGLEASVYAQGLTERGSDRLRRRRPPVGGHRCIRRCRHGRCVRRGRPERHDDGRHHRRTHAARSALDRRHALRLGNRRRHCVLGVRRHHLRRPPHRRRAPRRCRRGQWPRDVERRSHQPRRVRAMRLVHADIRGLGCRDLCSFPMAAICGSTEPASGRRRACLLPRHGPSLRDDEPARRPRRCTPGDWLVDRRGRSGLGLPRVLRQGGDACDGAPPRWPSSTPTQPSAALRSSPASSVTRSERRRSSRSGRRVSCSWCR